MNEYDKELVRLIAQQEIIKREISQNEKNIILELHTSDMGWHNHRDNHIHTNKAKIEESIVEANASIALIVCHILIFFLYPSDSFCSLEMSNVSLSSSSLRCSRSLSPLESSLPYKAYSFLVYLEYTPSAQYSYIVYCSI